MEALKYRSVFDIIGPVMVGPSSSHTAGAARIGKVTRAIFGGQPEAVEIDLYESFAKTYRGHGTDIALVGGLLGMEPDDERLSESLKIAYEEGMEVLFVPKKEKAEHPNSVTMHLKKGNVKMSVTGISIGGGNIQISELDGCRISLSLGTPTFIILHEDVPGLFSKIGAAFAEENMNIASATMTRQGKGDLGIAVLEIDETPEDASVRQRIKDLDHVINVTYFE